MDLQGKNRQSFLAACRNAFVGIQYAIKSERNLQIHGAITLGVLLFGFVWHITLLEWSILVICIGLVVGLELMNTAIEAVVDLSVGTQYHLLAKIAKDVAAGAVIVATICAVIVGALIFIPYILK